MIYPLVRELAVDGIPVAVTCRVLKIARQPYYRWLAAPVTDAELDEAYLANALFDAHRDDPEFGYRFLADEARDAGHAGCDRTRVADLLGQRLVERVRQEARQERQEGRARRSTTTWCSATSPPSAPNQLWLGDITEHRTGEGKLYLCAIKDVYSNRIVGYSISDRMKSRLAVDALDSAVARRGEVAGCIVHSDRGSQFRAGSSSAPCTATTWSGRWARSARPATTPPWRASSRCCRRTSSTAAAGPPARSCGSRSSPGSNGPTTAAADKHRLGRLTPIEFETIMTTACHSGRLTPTCHLFVQQSLAGARERVWSFIMHAESCTASEPRR